MRDRRLRRRRLLAPHRVGPRADRGRERAAVDPAHEPGLGELLQVAADRVERHDERRAQVGDDDLAVAGEPVEDHLAPFLGQHGAHSSTTAQLTAETGAIPARIRKTSPAEARMVRAAAGQRARRRRDGAQPVLPRRAERAAAVGEAVARAAPDVVGARPQRVPRCQRGTPSPSSGSSAAGFTPGGGEVLATQVEQGAHPQRRPERVVDHPAVVERAGRPELARDLDDEDLALDRTRVGQDREPDQRLRVGGARPPDRHVVLVCRPPVDRGRDARARAPVPRGAEAAVGQQPERCEPRAAAGVVPQRPSTIGGEPEVAFLLPEPFEGDIGVRLDHVDDDRRIRSPRPRGFCPSSGADSLSLRALARPIG